MKIPDNLVGLDFETYGTDLPKVGLYNYVNDPTFTPLIAAVMWSGEEDLEGALFDFVEDYAGERERLASLLKDKTIVAHNAGFEQAVLKQMGIDLPSERFVDSAVLARIAGAAGKLEAAGPQLLSMDKLESGWELIKLFSMPKDKDNTSAMFDPQMRQENIDLWAEFARYCALDAEIGLKLALKILPMIEPRELQYMHRTMDMNVVGWPVDMKMVKAMLDKYEENLTTTLLDFRIDTDEWELNLNSSQQCIAWCSARGVEMSSMDEQSVASALDKVMKELLKPHLDVSVRLALFQVQHLLLTKQALGGSSLKKLITLVNQVGADSRLHDSYLHAGAGATLRTTGRGVQMQNLPRLHGGGDDMAELLDENVEWSNDKMAHNLRQVFAAPGNGMLIVGDFSSVESRGLAWQAGEAWKIDAYFAGEDLYKRLATKITGKPLDQIGKVERTSGKVGELACGYGAGGGAVASFAKGMGINMSPQEAGKLVHDWRAACVETVQYWYGLEKALRAALTTQVTVTARMAQGVVHFTPVTPPLSLFDQDPRSTTIVMTMEVFEEQEPVLTRYIHGVRDNGRDITYYKPSERKTGDLWKDRFTDPKTGQTRRYTLYGGKLAGLLTQSLCREVFMHSLDLFSRWSKDWENVEVVGQFHDEIVVLWTPGQVPLEDAMQSLNAAMTTTILPRFPLAAEIKAANRYIK